MELLTFKGGIHPPGTKELTKEKSIVKAPFPKLVVIPLVQHLGAPAKPLVEPKTPVKVGTKIGEAQGFISANRFERFYEFCIDTTQLGILVTPITEKKTRVEVYSGNYNLAKFVSKELFKSLGEAK